jgi:hypothetical protein
MSAYEIDVQTYQALGYDLQAAVDTYTVDLAAHAQTEGVAAPGATSLVETIVKFYGGLWVIVPYPAPTVPERMPLPKDPKYYRSKDEQAKLLEYAANREKELHPEPQ